LPALAQSANCSNGTQLNQGQLSTLLSSFPLVCGRPGPSYPGAAADRWQEEHLGGEQLWDYKLGPESPTNKVDFRRQVGTWTISGTGANTRLTHTYGSTPYTWTVHGPNANAPGTSVYYFCSGGNEFARAYVTNSTTGCGGSYPP
jgi:hypothetical protein